MEMIIQAAELMNNYNGSSSFLCSYHQNFAKSKATILSVKAHVGELFPEHRLCKTLTLQIITLTSAKLTSGAP